VIGASGYLGGEVAARAASAGHRVVGTFHTASGTGVPTDMRRLDITDRAAVLALVAEVRPALVVNTAYVASQWTVTADGAASVALAAAQAGARLVHMSSDALHAGRPTPYTDHDTPTPLHLYGAAKAAAETAVAAIDPTAVIVRTSLIIGDDRSKQVQLALELITGRISGALFSDEFRCPIAVTDLADAVLELAATDVHGTINVAGPDATSRAELGRLVAHQHGLDPDRVPVKRIADGGLGPRPADVRLDSAYAAGLLTTRLRGARELLTGSPTASSGPPPV
jgi:dTDP-4-dehydrorhamnose reductase